MNCVTVDKHDMLHERRAAGVVRCFLALFVLPLAAAPHPQSLRIGVDQADPYQSWSAHGGATGFTVDVITEAAGVIGMNLVWTNCPEGRQRCLASGKVDLWPLVSVRAARDEKLYATEPWLENEYAIVWQSQSQDRSGPEPPWPQLRIAMAELPFTISLARQTFPQSRFDLTANRTVALEHLCQGLSQGAFMEVRLLEAMLLRRPAGCQTAQFRVRVFPQLRQSMSIAANSAFRAQADALRRQIGIMFTNGRFGHFVDRWFVFSNIEARSLVHRYREEREQLYSRLGFAGLTGVLVLLAVLYRRARAAERQAQKANRTKDDFLANISHEIRTPMNGVVGMAELLLESPLTSEQRDYAATIHQSARLQLEILNDILDSAKIDAGKLTLESVPFAPRELLTDVWRAYFPIASQKALRLTLDVPESLPSVLGDPLRVRQVLSNLVTNAIKFTPSGEVHLRAACEAAGPLYLLTFWVKDTGIGVAPEALPHIFDKFSQADSSVTRRYGGTGLGLSICRSLVERMNGAIQVETSPNAGSTFTVTLSLPVAERPAEREESCPAALHLEAPHPILIVEDNLINQKVATSLIRSLGLIPDVACSGEEALTKCFQNSYSAVLMDTQMPGIDGFETTRRLRRAGYTRLPILALTAGAMNRNRELAAQAGMDAFLTKPVDRRELARHLAAALTPLDPPSTAETTPGARPEPVVPSLSSTSR